MHKKFEINQTKIKDGCKSGRKVVTHNSKSDLPLIEFAIFFKVTEKVIEDVHYQRKRAGTQIYITPLLPG